MTQVYCVILTYRASGRFANVQVFADFKNAAAYAETWKQFKRYEVEVAAKQMD